MGRNDKNHLYGPEDIAKDRKNTEKRRDQQQFSRFSAALPLATNVGLNEPKAPAFQIDTKPQIGIPYDDTKGSVAASTQTVSFNVFGSTYTFYEVTGDVNFVFNELPIGHFIEFTLDIEVNQVAGVTIGFPTVTNPPTLAGNDNDRYVLKFIGVNRADPAGLVASVQTITFISGETGGALDAANRQLSNLGVTAINADLLFSASTFDIGSTVNPVDGVFLKRLRLEDGGVLLSTAVMIRNNATHLQMNVPVNTDAYEFAWAGTNRATLTAPGNLSLLDIDKIDLNSDLQFQNIASDPAVAGNMRMNGVDVKVFSGGAVRNFSDIVAGGGNEFDDSLFRIIDNLDNTKKLAFQVSGLTTATTRTITVPDANFTLGGLGLNQTWSGTNTFSSQVNLNGNIAGTGSLARDWIPDVDLIRILGSGTLRYAGVFTSIVRFDATTQFITADANGMRFEIPALDVFNFEVDNFDQLTVSNTEIDVHGNNITNVGEIVSTSGNVDVGDSATGFDAFFGRRIEFPNVLGVATAANREIISTTVSAINTIKINLPLNEDFMITENNITAPPALLLDTSAGTITFDDPIFAIRINNSAVFSITKFDTGAAIFTSNTGFSFNDIMKILTPAGQTALELDGVDGTPDVGLINTPANVDLEYSAGGTNKMRFDASANEFQFNADILRIQERLNIKETTVTPPTPPAGQCTLFLFDDGTAEPNNSLRVKFDNGNVQTIATEV